MLTKTCFSFALVGAAVFANAGLNGSTVSLEALFPNSSSVYSSAGTAVVGAGVEFSAASLSGYPLTFDFDDSGLTITSAVSASFNASSFNGFRVVVTSGPSITGAVFASGSFTPIISMNGSSLLLNYSGQAVTQGGTSRITIATSAVPGPAAVLPFALGLIARRRRRA